MSIPFTLATARHLPDGALLDIFIGTRNGVKSQNIGPSSRAKAKKDNQIARGVLLKRGYSAEVLDYGENE